MNRRVAMISGAVLFAAGGAILAFAGREGVPWGTACGMAGLGILAWTMLRGK